MRVETEISEDIPVKQGVETGLRYVTTSVK